MLLPDRELVVVHPHLEHVALDAGVGAEALHRRLVLLLDAPPHPLRELVQLLPLLHRELGTEALPMMMMMMMRMRIQMLSRMMRMRAWRRRRHHHHVLSAAAASHVERPMMMMALVRAV